MALLTLRPVICWKRPQHPLFEHHWVDRLLPFNSSKCMGKVRFHALYKSSRRYDIIGRRVYDPNTTFTKGKIYPKCPLIVSYYLLPDPADALISDGTQPGAAN